MDPVLRDRRIQTICLLILSAVALGGALYWLRPVMIPFVLAIFFALALSPLVDAQMRWLRLPRPLAVLGTLVLGLLLFSLLAVLVSASVRQLAANAAGYQAKVTQLLIALTELFPLERFGMRPEAVLAPLSEIPVGAVGGLLRGTTNAILDTLSQSLLVLIFVIYLLVGGAGGSPASRTWREIENRIQRFLVTKAVVSAATGFLVGVVLSMLGIDLALVFGLFAFLLNFIPSLGSVIATLLPLPVVIASPDVSVTVAVLAITIPGAIQLTIGNLIEPRVMGESLDLHPIVILMALIFWGMLWGIVGMLLATPITAVLKILFEKLDYTRPLATLLAGRLDGIRSADAA